MISLSFHENYVDLLKTDWIFVLLTWYLSSQYI